MSNAQHVLNYIKTVESLIAHNPEFVRKITDEPT